MSLFSGGSQETRNRLCLSGRFIYFDHSTTAGQTLGSSSAGNHAGNPECLPKALYLGSSRHSDTQAPVMTGACLKLMVHSHTKSGNGQFK
jgi:hypothetical protein